MLINAMTHTNLQTATQTADIAADYIEDGFCKYIKAALLKSEKSGGHGATVQENAIPAPGELPSIDLSYPEEVQKILLGKFFPQVTDREEAEETEIADFTQVNTCAVTIFQSQPYEIQLKIAKALTMESAQWTIESAQALVKFLAQVAPQLLTTDSEKWSSETLQNLVTAIQAETVTRESAECSPESIQQLMAASYMNEAAKPVNSAQKADQLQTQELPNSEMTLEEAKEIVKAITSQKNIQMLFKAGGDESYAKLQGQFKEGNEILKAWEHLTMTAAKPVILEKPEEFSELRNSFTELTETDKLVKPEAQQAEKANPEKAEKSEKSEEPAAVEVKAEQTVIKTTTVTRTEVRFLTIEVVRISKIIEEMHAHLKNGTRTFEVNLNPLELGKITIKMTKIFMKTTIVITAERAETKILLENAANRILAALDKNDVKLESMTVEHEPDYSEQQENQDQGNREQEENQDENGEASENGEKEMSFAELLESL